MRQIERRILLSPSLGWATLLPWQITLKGNELLLGAAFLALLTIPAGYWSGRSTLSAAREEQPTLGGWILPPLLISGGLIAAAAIAGTHTAKPAEVLGILLGFATGIAAARASLAVRPGTDAA